MHDSIRQIEAAIEKLPPEALAELRAWLHEFEKRSAKSSPQSNSKTLNAFRGKIAFKGDPVEVQRGLRDEWPD